MCPCHDSKMSRNVTVLCNNLGSSQGCGRSKSLIIGQAALAVLHVGVYSPMLLVL